MRTLTPEQAKFFFTLHRRLILFTNNKYKICKSFQSIEDIENLGDQDIKNYINPIREKMYQRDNIKQFCDRIASKKI